MEDRQTILIVDDTPENIDILSSVLHETYKVKAALNGEQALKILEKKIPIDMILLDVMMPEMDGYEVCRIIKKNPAWSRIPIIFITALSSNENEELGLDLGAVDYLTKPINPAITRARIKTHLALYDQNRALEHQVHERTEELYESRLSIIRQLGRAAEYKDNETGLHVLRMSLYTKLIAEAMVGSKTEWTENVYQASSMHDVGKIGIPDHILLKPGKLSDLEWQFMKNHPEYGAEIIGDHDSKLLQIAREIALTHHEKWDGSGYPYGLKGEEIPLCGRIVAVADVFDALTSDRPYKRAWSIEEAVEYITRASGVDFDPEVVKCFDQVLFEIISVKKELAEAEDNDLREFVSKGIS